LRSRLICFINRFNERARLPEQIPQLLAFLERFAGISAVFERVFVARWSARTCSTAVHPATLLPAHRRRISPALRAEIDKMGQSREGQAFTIRGNSAPAGVRVGHKSKETENHFQMILEGNALKTSLTLHRQPCGERSAATSPTSRVQSPTPPLVDLTMLRL
jgi:hypothetical protein